MGNRCVRTVLKSSPDVVSGCSEKASTRNTPAVERQDTIKAGNMERQDTIKAGNMERHGTLRARKLFQVQMHSNAYVPLLSSYSTLSALGNTGATCYDIGGDRSTAFPEASMAKAFMHRSRSH